MPFACLCRALQTMRWPEQLVKKELNQAYTMPC